MRTPRRIALAIAGPGVLMIAGCGVEDTRTSDSATTQTTATAGGAPSPAQERDMRIEISIGKERFRAVLDESAAARDLLGQLPVTLNMRDHGGVEKTGRLPSALPLDGQPAGADPDVGDVGYYAPGNDLVLYYGDQSYYEGIVVLGHMEGDAARQIADMDGTIKVTVAAVRH